MEAYRRKRHEPVLGYDSWEALALQEKPDEFHGSTFDEYLAFIGPPGRAAARGN